VQINAHANDNRHIIPKQLTRYSKKIKMIKIKITGKHKVIVSKIYQFIQQTSGHQKVYDDDI